MEDILKKFKFKGDPIVLNAPLNLQKVFDAMGFENLLKTKEKCGNLLLFVNNKEEYLSFLNQQLSQVAYDGVLWFAYPKGSSKIKTDINRDSLWAIGETYGITSVTAISIDETWSAIRFRPIEKVGKK